jgi:hypothetical protein
LQILRLLCWVLLHSGPAAHATQSDTFDETLLLKSLPSGAILAHFSFATTKQLGQFGSEDEDYSHFHLFPKVMGQAMRKSRVREFRLSFTSKKSGVWDQNSPNSWGEPLSDGPGGAELWADISSSVHGSAQRWAEFRRTLAGTFCSSLDLMGQQETVEPSVLMPGQTASRNHNRTKTRLFYGALPREAVCTENLTPWLKLLPCRRHAGLASLMNPLKLFAGEYHSMKVHGEHVCDDSDAHGANSSDGATGTNCALHLTQTFTAVVHPWYASDGR